MKVVSDSSAVCYLTLIGELHLLSQIFGEVLIPPAVEWELTASGAPPAVRKTMRLRPEWLKIHQVHTQFDEALSPLHPGEREAILLAEQVRVDIVLLDERQAREIAQTRGIHLTGLLGILNEAAAYKIVDLPRAVDRLRRTNFRIAPLLLKELLEQHIVGNP